MATLTVFRVAIIMVAFALLSACVVGQQLRFDNTPVHEDDLGHGKPVEAQVEDHRPAVTSGKEHPWYVGRYRAGLGNPWDVTTEGEVPLAEQIQVDLAEELDSLGFDPRPGGRLLNVKIHEWDFTGYQNGRFWYDLEVNVLDPAGQVAASSRLHDEIEIRGTLMLGARGGFERDMPGIYAEIIASVVRDNPLIRQSLAR